MTHRLRSHALLTAFAVCAVLAAVVVPATAAGASKTSDLQTARTGVIVAADLGSGWTGKRATPTPDAKVIEVASKIPSCKDYVKLRKVMAPLPQARSLDFADGTGTTVQNWVRAFPSQKAADAALQLFSSPKMPTCLDAYLATGLSSDESAQTRQTDLAGAPTGTVAYTTDVADSSGTVVAEITSVTVPVGRYLFVVNVQVTTPDPPTAVVDAAIDASLTRLQDAVG